MADRQAGLCQYARVRETIEPWQSLFDRNTRFLSR